MSLRIHAGLAIALALATSGVAADSKEEPKIEAVSNRADLVSGGDVLLRVTLPRKSSAAVLSLNGVPMPGALHAAPDGNGYLALLSGLVLGQNTVAVAAGPHKAHLTVTNHPIGGPIFSGPHLQPWLCTTAANGLAVTLDADCNAPTIFRFFYKNTATPPAFVAYDPANPPPGRADRRDHHGPWAHGAVHRAAGNRYVKPDDLPHQRAFRSFEGLDAVGAAAGMERQGALPLRRRRGLAAHAGQHRRQRVRRQRLVARLRHRRGGDDRPRHQRQRQAERRSPDDGERTSRGGLRADPLHHRLRPFGRRDPAAQHRRPVSWPARRRAAGLQLSGHVVAGGQ